MLYPEVTWIDQIVFPVFFLWFIGLILVFFRKDLEIIWKISFLICFVVYLVVFGREWSQSIQRLELHPGWEIRAWIYGLGKALFYFLFLLWPMTLIRIFYSNNRYLVSQTAVILVSTTFLFWLFFWLYFQWEEKIDLFFRTQFMSWF